MASKGRRTYLKDLKVLYDKLESSTDGQGIVSSSTNSVIVVKLRPNSGYNAHASFQLTMEVPNQYPYIPPDVTFFTPIFHPNINFFDGRVCLSILDDWTGCYGLLDIVKAILYLIANPNFDSANNSFGYLREGEVVEVITKRVLAGLPVGSNRSRIYPPNRDWCEWAAERGFRPEENLLDDDASIDTKLIALSYEPSITSTAAVEIDQYSDDRLSEGTMSSCSSLDTVPSVARIRYSVADDVSGNSSDCFLKDPNVVCRNLLLQRILIRHPDDHDEGASAHSVYYYCGMYPAPLNLPRLGMRYDELHRETHHTLNMYDRQSSSLIPWLTCFFKRYTTPHFYSSRSTTPCVDLLFQQNLSEKQPRITLTADFCPWSQTDNLGTCGIFGYIFAHRKTPPQSLDDIDLEGLFSSISIVGMNEVYEGEVEEIFSSDHSYCDVYSITDGGDDEVDDVCDDDDDDDDVCEEGEEETDSAEHHRNLEELTEDDDDTNTTSSTSNRSQQSVAPYVELFKFQRVRRVIAQIEPQWHWFFRQSRWPLRFAPNQTLDVSTEGIGVPPWRNTAGGLMADVCGFCKKRPDVINLILLDPMALSPLSPVLNMLRFSSESQPQLVGVLWLNPLDALSPYYRVPLPPPRDVDGHPYPGSNQLRLLALTALISNWLSWFSRIEVYSSLGQSRFSSELICDSVAAHILGPYSLGCGQAPIFDLWPLWLARRLFALSWSLPRSPNCVFVPFSDLDEI